MDTMRVRVGTQNVKNFPAVDTKGGMPHEAVGRVIRAAAGRADIVHWQEMGSKWHEAAAAGLGEFATYWGNPAHHSDDPISYRRDRFAFISGGSVLAHKGKTGVCTHRYIVWVILRDKATGITFFDSNVHPVSAAFNGRVDRLEGLRWKMWQEFRAVHRSLINKQKRAGLPILGGGDFNKQLVNQKTATRPQVTVGRPFTSATYHVPERSIDHIYTIDAAGFVWTEIDRLTFDSKPSDHNGRLAVLDLTNTKKLDPPSKPPLPSAPVGQPMDRIVWKDGNRTVDRLTALALHAVEKRLGYGLTIVQGSYNKGVGASAGTHDGGGVIDLAPWDYKRKVAALRAVGFAAWYRPAIPGLWGAHIHAVLIGHPLLAPVAARQITAYRNGRDGLKSNRRDTTPRPSPIPVFKWPTQKAA